jgi:argininosuccinate synthase
MSDIKKVVLAYSGGMEPGHLKWLKKNLRVRGRNPHADLGRWRT